ncbi:MAG: hypothetical protein FWG52_09360 [Proteobacteria bacterium]|nr:hypothetical protein [Pseudomonadota bacterium]
MAQINPDQMASALLAEGFSQNHPDVTLPNPAAVTTMVVTLDQLRPFEFNPRVRKNPLYDEIKASIRERGLDIPPGITRRPGQEHYIIRNGGNTRLSILRELWGETREERFFRLQCWFHPWTARGDIEALTAHLTENELRSGLTFIERSLAVQKAQQLYEELEPGQPAQPMSQSELARRLKADGYPVTQPHISRMREAIAFLLPAIPNTLYAGLGRGVVEKLSGLRRVALQVWSAHRAEFAQEADGFTLLFQEVLSEFDTGPESFALERIQDELTGRMADALGLRYETLAAELYIFEGSTLKPGQPGPQPLVEIKPATVEEPPPAKSSARLPKTGTTPDSPKDTQTDPSSTRQDQAAERQIPAAPGLGRTSPGPELTQTVRERLSGAALENEPAQAKPIGPAHAGGLYPSSDCWHIAPEHDTPRYLRILIAQCAREIAFEAELHDAIAEEAHGIGFACMPANADGGDVPAVLALLHVLSAPYLPEPQPIDAACLIDSLGPLLLGSQQGVGGQPQGDAISLTDGGLITLLRLIRLSRRLLESAPDDAIEAQPSDE